MGSKIWDFHFIFICEPQFTTATTYIWKTPTFFPMINHVGASALILHAPVCVQGIVDYLRRIRQAGNRWCAITVHSCENVIRFPSNNQCRAITRIQLLNDLNQFLVQKIKTFHIHTASLMYAFFHKKKINRSNFHSNTVFNVFFLISGYF